MKLTLVASILAIIAPLGHSTSLRKTVLKSIDTKAKSTLKTKVVIPGAVGEPSANDLDILGQALIESYNYVKTCPYGCCHCGEDAEHEQMTRLTGFQVADIQAWTCPYGCCLCPNDDEEQKLVGFAAVADSPAAKLHGFAVLMELGCTTSDCSDIDKAAMEKSICARIKSSTSTFWKGAYNCALDLAVSDDDHVQSELESKVVIPGVVGEPSASDLDILGKAMLESYNYLKTCPYGCCTCGNDSEELTRLTGFKVGPYDIQTWTCPYGCCLCPNDDEEQVKLGSENSVERQEMAVSMVLGCHGSDCGGINKAELENAVCARLKSSGSSYWSGANNCAIVDFAKNDKGLVSSK